MSHPVRGTPSNDTPSHSGPPSRAPTTTAGIPTSMLSASRSSPAVLTNAEVPGRRRRTLSTKALASVTVEDTTLDDPQQPAELDTTPQRTGQLFTLAPNKTESTANANKRLNLNWALAESHIQQLNETSQRTQIDVISSRTGFNNRLLSMSAELSDLQRQLTAASSVQPMGVDLKTLGDNLERLMAEGKSGKQTLTATSEAIASVATSVNSLARRLDNLHDDSHKSEESLRSRLDVLTTHVITLAQQIDAQSTRPIPERPPVEPHLSLAVPDTTQTSIPVQLQPRFTRPRPPSMDASVALPNPKAMRLSATPVRASPQILIHPQDIRVSGMNWGPASKESTVFNLIVTGLPAPQMYGTPVKFFGRDPYVRTVRLPSTAQAVAFMRAFNSHRPPLPSTATAAWDPKTTPESYLPDRSEPIDAHSHHLGSGPANIPQAPLAKSLQDLALPASHHTNSAQALTAEMTPYTPATSSLQDLAIPPQVSHTSMATAPLEKTTWSNTAPSKPERAGFPPMRLADLIADLSNTLGNEVPTSFPARSPPAGLSGEDLEGF